MPGRSMTVDSPLQVGAALVGGWTWTEAMTAVGFDGALPRRTIHIMGGDPRHWGWHASYRPAKSKRTLSRKR